MPTRVVQVEQYSCIYMNIVHNQHVRVHVRVELWMAQLQSSPINNSSEIEKITCRTQTEGVITLPT